MKDDERVRSGRKGVLKINLSLSGSINTAHVRRFYGSRFPKRSERIPKEVCLRKRAHTRPLGLLDRGLEGQRYR